MNFKKDLRASRKRRAETKIARAETKIARIKSTELAELREQMNREGWDCAFGGVPIPKRQTMDELIGLAPLSHKERLALRGTGITYRGNLGSEYLTPPQRQGHITGIVPKETND